MVAENPSLARFLTYPSKESGPASVTLTVIFWPPALMMTRSKDLSFAFLPLTALANSPAMMLPKSRCFAIGWLLFLCFRWIEYLFHVRTEVAHATIRIYRKSIPRLPCVIVEIHVLIHPANVPFRGVDNLEPGLRHRFEYLQFQQYESHAHTVTFVDAFAISLRGPVLQVFRIPQHQGPVSRVFRHVQS